METIHKTQLRFGLRDYAIPADAEILSFAVQRGVPTIWYRTKIVEIQPTPLTVFTPPPTGRPILLIETGSVLPEHMQWKFIGTVLLENDNYVLHAFEMGEGLDIEEAV